MREVDSNSQPLFVGGYILQTRAKNLLYCLFFSFTKCFSNDHRQTATYFFIFLVTNWFIADLLYYSQRPITNTRH